MPSRMKAIRTLVEAHLTTGFTGITFTNEPKAFDDIPRDKFPHAIVLLKEDDSERLDFKQERRRVVAEVLVALITTPGDTAEAARESMDLQLQGLRDAVFADPQVRHREMQVSVPYPGARGGQIDLIGNPIKYSKTPVAYDRPPPRLGEHTEEVLEELLDLSPAEVAHLRESGAI